ncbi:DUF805 domain-containing protein [Verminephrobacter aporrectodeae subsp. tuberculatae]|nr:DUF805 domain-containing protein [Verminephrobacter aporrectodeae subsp. tuberculatae]
MRLHYHPVTQRCATFIQGDSIVGFFSAVKSCLRQYVGFSGRATRDEFWWFFLFQWLLLMGFLILGVTLDKVFFTIGWGLMILLLLPAWAVGARRLHDIGSSGWLQAVPFVYPVLLYRWAQPSKESGEE